MVTGLAALYAAFQYALKQPASKWAAFTDSWSATKCVAAVPKGQLACEVDLLYLQAT